MKLMDKFNNILDITEERISGLKDRLEKNRVKPGERKG